MIPWVPCVCWLVRCCAMACVFVHSLWVSRWAHSLIMCCTAPSRFIFLPTPTDAVSPITWNIDNTQRVCGCMEKEHGCGERVRGYLRPWLAGFIVKLHKLIVGVFLHCVMAFIQDQQTEHRHHVCKQSSLLGWVSHVWPQCYQTRALGHKATPHFLLCIKFQTKSHIPWGL